MKIDGGCHCGAISYEAEADPEKAGICHCTDCQVLSGTAFRTILPVPEGDFRILSGKPKEYIKTAESGNRRIQAFCGDCGAPLYATAVGEGPRVLNLRVGTVRQRGRLVPRFQVWARSAQSWLPAMADLTTRETQ